MKTINLAIDEETARKKDLSGRTWRNIINRGIEIPEDCPTCGTPLNNGKCPQPAKHGGD